MSRPRALALLCLLLWPALLAAAEPADMQRLNAGLEAGFRRPTVIVYPVLDQRLLGAAQVPAGPTLFDTFVTELGKYDNLNLGLPEQTLARMRMRRDWAARELFAKSKATEGLDDYKQVSLDAAVRHLKEAGDLYAVLEYPYVEPRAVAQAELTRGLALLEQGNGVDASLAFTRALQFDPRLRMREKYDRPESVAAFERARAALLAAPGEPPGFDVWPEGEPAGNDIFILRARLVPSVAPTPDRLEVVVIGSGGSLVADRQNIGPADGAERLASRIWTALPFGRGQRAKAREAEIRLDAGFGWFLYADNQLGTGVFNNVGAQTALAWTVARHIGVQAAFLVASSGRDREEDLRKDILTLRGFIGPGYETRLGPWHLDAHLGVEVASPGKIVTTDNKACKHFGPDDGLGYLPCSPSSISETPRTVVAGVGLTAGAGLDLVDDFFLSLDLWGAEYFFKVDETDLGRPLGAALSLGYRFH